jgi:hypothetical protein
MREPNYKCDQCGKEGYKRPSLLKNRKNIFCCKECSDKFKDKRVEVICLVCQKVFLKEQCEIKRYGRHCCSKKCGQLLGIFYKDWGSSRSKLEIAIEAHLVNLFSFQIDYNKTDIGYELDIFIPHLNQAIELNGIFHYEPIFGEKELLRRQRVDKAKAEECKKRNIDLIVINVSKDKRSKKVQTQRIQEVVKIISDKIAVFSEPKVIQMSMEF